MFLRSQRPSSPENEPSRYQYLSEAGSLSDWHVELTLMTYMLAAQKYSEIEYQASSIEAVVKQVVKEVAEYVVSLPPGSKISLPAVASGRDLILLGLLKKEVHLYGYDITQNLLELGRHLLFPNVAANDMRELNRQLNELPISDVIEQAVMTMLKNGMPANGWVVFFKEVLDNAKLNLSDEDPDLIVRNSIRAHMASIVADLQRRVHLVQGKMQDNFFAPESFDLTLVVAAYPNLTDESFVTSLDEAMKQLKPGGKLFFNVRFDGSPVATDDGLEGRIFTDSVLTSSEPGTHKKQNLPRYFRTFSKDDLEKLEFFIAERYGCQIEDKGISPHWDRNKPMFAKFLITKQLAR